MATSRRFDRPFLSTTVLIAVVGFFIFASASLGLLSRQGPNFNLVFSKQLIVLLVGLVLVLVVSRINYQHWQRLAFILFIAAVAASLLVFIPGVGLMSGGAQRWIEIGNLSIQPSEFLKLAFVIYLAAWLSRPNRNIRSWKQGIGPLLLIVSLVGVILIAEPDIDTLIILLLTAMAMLLVKGAKWSHLLLIGLLSLGAIAVLVYTKPYIMNRLQTFFNPDSDVLGQSYQINQSLIAIGSGGLTGRGFGQSIQKFKYLPEPIGDSIFAVASEEFGLAGATTIILLFLAFNLFGLRVASRATTEFGRLVTVGIVIMIMSSAFVHIAALLGLIPLSGTPLIFVSQGGTALLLALAAAGIVLNVSKHISR